MGCLALPVVTVSAESSEVVVEHDRCEISNLLVFQKARKSASGDLDQKENKSVTQDLKTSIPISKVDSYLVSAVGCAICHGGLVEGQDVGPRGEKSKKGPHDGEGANHHHKQEEEDELPEHPGSDNGHASDQHQKKPVQA